MYIIDKDEIENYRYAIAKDCFLRVYPQYIFIQDIEKSNCMVMVKDNCECIVSLFSKPKTSMKKIKKIYSFYDKQHYKRGLEKGSSENIHIIELSDEYIHEYNTLFALAIKKPKEYMEKRNENSRIFCENILLSGDEIRRYNRNFYKYYAQSTIEEKKYGVIDGNISFVDPSTFNDPFDVNCYFANNKDMSKLFRIFCVAPSPKEILMWSYYGTEHKGYCMEYKEQDILNSIKDMERDGLCIIGNVDYKDSRAKQKSKLNAISLTELKFYVEAAFTKFSEWSHEKEYRYVILSDSFSEENDKYLTRNIPINRVFCGCRGAGTTVINSAGETMHTERVTKHKRIFELE